MKIVMLCDLYDERLAYQENLLAKYYGKYGHDVTVVASTFDDAFSYVADRYDATAPARCYADGATKVIKRPYSLNVLNKLRRLSGVAEVLEAEQPDMIFVHSIHLNLPEVARYKRRHPSVRVIMDFHADYSNSAKNWLSLNVLHRVIRRSFFSRYRHTIDQIYTVIPAASVFLEEVYGVPRRQVRALPLGADVDVAREIAAAQAGRDIRTAREIPMEAIVIFTGGKLARTKMTHLLIEAVRSLSHPDLHLMLVGDTAPEDRAYKRLLTDIAAGDPRIHFVGWVEAREVYRYMDACDLAVFPASQSVMWQQCLSMGLPLIVGEVPGQDASYMNVCGNMAILKHGDVSATAIAAKIRQFTTDREALRQLQAAALQATEQLFDYNKIVHETLAACIGYRVGGMSAPDDRPTLEWPNEYG
jgi:glycosyltransferase involved in cell wall biosynthesis